jgi:putative ABC transport system permease protein
MLMITLRDLQWRRRRVMFGVAGTALVFAVTLLLAGMSASLRAEAHRTIDGVGADAFVSAAGVTGPFSGLSGLPTEAVTTLASTPGVTHADPLVVALGTVGRDRLVDVTVFGFRPGGLGHPRIVEGRDVVGRREAVVDTALPVRLGYRFTLGGRQLTAVGKVEGLTLRAGVPNVYVSVEDAQEIFYRSAPIINAVVTRGVPESAPAGTAVLTSRQARGDLLRPFRRALAAIDLLRILLWAVAATIVGTIIYLSVLERVGDFAVLKAIGTRNSALLWSLGIQAVVVSVLSAGVAVALSQLIKPTFDVPLSLTARDGLILPLVAVGIGLLSSVAALRRAVSVDPAVAFGGA